ncbi:peptidylprolyl isomerase [Magnetospirillum sp. SS-4]|uniref:peptidylprolyl isomerase n=1 Tax=Magnetospirillum sp. SS-4 TaxID=2681465 RepID=UPI00137DD2F6|nr:peptidylprolyl isomerase [Magnetospirillum sp. SS-4]CAA7627196.1 Peptidyl-prolyl cis-trans isomerase [Magnetospirillum sp. SS-4]
MLARFAVVIVACVTLSAIPFSGRAQDIDRIAAVVNDDVISLRDLDTRLKMALVMTGLPDNIENRRRAVPQVLRKMVDERLQVQEATRVGVSVSGDDVNRSIRNLEQQNGMPPGGLAAYMTQRGIDIDAIRDQIRADLTWMKLTGRMLQQSIRASEEEINDRLETMRQKIGRPEYNLAEIVLGAETPSQEEESRRLGERLIDQLKAGAPFAALARQFSQSATAGQGGVLGWMSDATLDDEVREAVAPLEKDQISPLIRTGNGFTIIAMIDKRIFGSGGGKDETVSVAQIFFPLPADGQIPREQIAAKAAEMSQAARSCDAFEEIGRQLKSPRSGRIDNTLKSGLPLDIQKIIGELPVGQASKPVNAGDGFLVFMVCSRSAAPDQGGLPSRDVIRRQIEDQKMDIQGKRYLRDLRRAAFIDFRL